MWLMGNLIEWRNVVVMWLTGNLVGGRDVETKLAADSVCACVSLSTVACLCKNRLHADNSKNSISIHSLRARGGAHFRSSPGLAYTPDSTDRSPSMPLLS